MTDRQLADRISAAKLWLVGQSAQSGRDAPRGLAYLSQALVALVTVPTDDVPTIAADDRWRIYVNEQWLASVSVAELGRELAHLTWHLLLDHADRARGMGVGAHTAGAWGCAAHVGVDSILLTEAASPSQLGPDHPCGLRHGQWRRRGQPDPSTEEHFALLSGLPVAAGPGPASDHPTPHCGSACDGIPRAYELSQHPDTPQVTPSDADTIRYAVATEIRQSARSRGGGPDHALRWAARVLDSQLPWERLLAVAVRKSAVATSGRSQRTWSRLSRRASVLPKILLPGWHRFVPEVAIVIDTSGSVDDVLLAAALGEVDGALRGLGVPGGSIALYSCDSAAHALGRVRRASSTTLVGGGGTEMGVGIAAALAATPRPNIIVVLTDGITDWPQEPPRGCSVVIAVLGHPGDLLPPTPAWARRIECFRE